MQVTFTILQLLGALHTFPRAPTILYPPCIEKFALRLLQLSLFDPFFLIKFHSFLLLFFSLPLQLFFFFSVFPYFLSMTLPHLCLCLCLSLFLLFVYRNYSDFSPFFFFRFLFPFSYHLYLCHLSSPNIKSRISSSLFYSINTRETDFGMKKRKLEKRKKYQES